MFLQLADLGPGWREVTPTEGSGDWVVELVRQGDLVTEIFNKNGGTADARQLATRAAARLCTGTPVC